MQCKTTNPLFALLLLAALSPTPTRAAPASVEQRIRRIEADVLPEVLVAGEIRPKVTLAARMSAMHVPGLSIAVIHQGRIEWARGYGISRPGGPSVSPTTLFQAASISKPVTAFAVMRLVQENKLDLDTDVNHYLTHWKLPDSEFTQERKVTLRGLLTHSAGMTVHGFLGYASNMPRPNLLQVLDGVPPANSAPVRVAARPGSEWNYSGGGYEVAQQLLQDVTGEPFDRFMQETVLAPLGMKHSTFAQPLPEARRGEATAPFDEEGNALSEGAHVHPEQAAAGLWTTPSDLATYALGVQKSLKGHGLLSAMTARQMLTPGLNLWGLGAEIGGKPEHRYFEHTGGNAGYRCVLVAYEEGDGAILMTNADSGGSLVMEALRTIAQEYDWPDFRPGLHTIAQIAPEHFDALAGSYELRPGSALSFWREGSRFWSQVVRQGPVEVFPEDERRYFAKAVDAEVAFQTDASGHASGIVFRQGGRETHAARMDEGKSKAIAEVLERQNKRFKDQSAAPGGEAAIRRLLEGIARGQPDYTNMSESLAALTRQHLNEMQKFVTSMGTIQSVTFMNVEEDGTDFYRISGSARAARCGLFFAADGKLEEFGLRPALK